MEVSTSVLIACGSLNGLTMAMLLARRRVRCLVLEYPTESRRTVRERANAFDQTDMTRSLR